MDQEIINAYLYFIHSVPRRSAALPFNWTSEHHRCNNQCDVIVHRDVVICKQTGNWHHCTEATCDRLITTHEHRVCELSGFTYDLFLVMDVNAFQSNGGSGDNSNEQEQQEQDPSGEREMDYADEEPAHEQQDPTSSTDLERIQRKTKQQPIIPDAIEGARMQLDDRLDVEPSPFPQAPQASPYDVDMDPDATSFNVVDIEPDGDELEVKHSPPPSEHVDSISHLARIALFESMLMLTFPQHHETHMALFREIAANAEGLWIIVRDSPRIQESKHKYPPEYHLLVIVYYMCHGYAPFERVVVPANEWVMKNIPQVRDLKKVSTLMGGIRVSTYTQTSKLFKAAIVERMRSNRSNFTWDRLPLWPAE